MEKTMCVEKENKMQFPGVPGGGAVEVVVAGEDNAERLCAQGGVY